MNLLELAIFIAIVEVGLYVVVSLQRRNFPWLITQRDEVPALDSRALQKFIDYSFDPHLGWVRKPGSSGTENGQKGVITYHIDSSGSRVIPNEKLPHVVAAFGDSYAFCRQVEDNETWEAQLSELTGCGVSNFGVGNYGVDQALLRYEGMVLPDTVRFVVMGFVPETICRIQSYWKHYLEFGNTFAFKPRFILHPDGRLALLENQVRNAEDFALYHEKLPEIRKADRFYANKFRSYQFRFPYTLTFMRNPLRHGTLILSIAMRGLLRTFGYTNPRTENLPFTLVMKSNLRESYRLYGDSKSTKLLSAILLRFKNVAQLRGHIPLIVVMPQLLDLKLNNNKSAPYQAFFRELAHELPVLELTRKFISAGFERLYINDQYGGHLSPDGNRLVAEEISDWLASRYKA